MLVVPVGTTVTWIGKDAEGHDVESEIPGLFHATVAPGTSFGWTFDTPGTFAYHCCCGLLEGVIIVK
jgi:plastocyanin